MGTGAVDRGSPMLPVDLRNGIVYFHLLKCTGPFHRSPMSPVKFKTLQCSCSYFRKFPVGFKIVQCHRTL